MIDARAPEEWEFLRSNQWFGGMGWLMLQELR